MRDFDALDAENIYGTFIIFIYQKSDVKQPA